MTMSVAAPVKIQGPLSHFWILPGAQTGKSAMLVAVGKVRYSCGQWNCDRRQSWRSVGRSVNPDPQNVHQAQRVKSCLQACQTADQSPVGSSTDGLWTHHRRALKCWKKPGRDGHRLQRLVTPRCATCWRSRPCAKPKEDEVSQSTVLQKRSFCRRSNTRTSSGDRLWRTLTASRIWPWNFCQVRR